MNTNSKRFFQGNPYKRPNSPYYYISYLDASGSIRRESAKTKDLAIAREMLTQRKREVEKQKVGHVDRFAETRRMPLENLIELFRRHLEGEQRDPRYVSGTLRQLREFVRFAKIATLPQIAIVDVERFLADLRQDRSAKTRDHYAGALRGFGKWLVRTGRWDADPFHGVSVRTATRDKDRKFRRVGLLYDQAVQLVEAAWARFEAEKARGGQPSHAQHQDGDAVRDRQVLYWFALTTGFRAKECASVRWEDLTLTGNRLSVRLAGRFTKNGDDAFVPLQPFMAEQITEMRKRRTARRVRDGERPVTDTDLVFHVPDKIAELVRKDAAFAGLTPQRGPTSKRIDFHALRKSCARILIELGLHPKVVQTALRHSDIRLTMDLYGEFGDDDLFRELAGKIPAPPSPKAGNGVCSGVGSGRVLSGAGGGTTWHANGHRDDAATREVSHA